MHTTTAAAAVGAGQAGLAMSQRLTERSVDHVVLERGDVADAWRTKRWPGLRLLTPNWMLGLPGRSAPPGARPDPDGHLTAPEVADLVAGYAWRIAAPVHPRVTVRAVRRAPGGYEVVTDAGEWRAAAVVVASPRLDPCRPGCVHPRCARAWSTGDERRSASPTSSSVPTPPTPSPRSSPS